MADQPDPQGVLHGIRVLDFGRYIAGPFCGALLADLGADVLRIERVDGSEDRFVIPVAADGAGAMFLQTNRGKRGMTLNPTKPAGREIVAKLVATADVVIANLPPSVLTRMGIDYESLTAIKPDIILTTVSAFGEGGPYSDRVGFDGVGQAMSGAMHLAGSPDEPARTAVPYVDYNTASFAALGTVAALMARQQTGQGQHVQGSLMATALTVAGPTLTEQALTNVNRIATGNRSQLSAPNDVFQTQDGWIIMSVIGAPLFERIIKLIDEPAWLTDPRLASDLDRADHGEEISKRLGEWCAAHTTADALAKLNEARVPAGPVYTPQQALDDPHAWEAGILQNVSYPSADKPAPLTATPITLSHNATAIQDRAPTLGEHTDDILRTLGYDDDAIAALHNDRIV